MGLSAGGFQDVFSSFIVQTITICLLKPFYPQILFAKDSSRDVLWACRSARKIASLAWKRPRVQIPTSPYPFTGENFVKRA